MPDTPPIVAEAPARLILAISRAYSMQTRDRIPGQWQAWFDAGYKVPEARPGAMYGVSYKADGAGNFHYAVGVEVDGIPDTLPDGTCIVTLEAGPHAVLRRFGPVADLPGAFDWLFATWLPASDWAPRPGAVYEVYPDDPRNGPDGMAWEIWAPVALR